MGGERVVMPPIPRVVYAGVGAHGGAPNAPLVW
jgi:hypothetical protein